MWAVSVWWRFIGFDQSYKMCKLITVHRCRLNRYYWFSAGNTVFCRISRRRSGRKTERTFIKHTQTAKWSQLLSDQLKRNGLNRFSVGSLTLTCPSPIVTSTLNNTNNVHDRPARKRNYNFYIFFDHLRLVCVFPYFSTDIIGVSTVGGSVHLHPLRSQMGVMAQISGGKGHLPPFGLCGYGCIAASVREYVTKILIMKYEGN